MVKEALFYKDKYLKEFEATVVDCLEEKGKFKVILDNTAFYPEGGGQPSDTGFMNDVKVLKVEEKNNVIYHIVDSKIEPSTKVNCKINYEERFINMQHHSGEHIVSGIICKKYNTSNIGFHIGTEFTTMDFPVNISEEDLREIEKKANYAIYENFEIIETFYTPEEAKNIEYRSKKELKEDIRIVEFPGYDICACCGIHVSRSGEIGIIKLLKVEKYKGGSRIYMLAGFKAVEDYTNKFMQIDNISTLLSLKPNEVYQGVCAKEQEAGNLKKEIGALKRKMHEEEISKIPKSKNYILDKDDIESNDIKNICKMLEDKVDDIYGVISNGRFMIMSKSSNLKEIFDEAKKTLKINGGGSNNMIQGKIDDNKEEFLKFFI